MARQGTLLLIIDPQNDFCDLPEGFRPPDPLAGDGARLAPALPVPGAHADLTRLAGLVRAGGTGLAEIWVTLDSHHRLDIAHPGFWRGRDGAPPAAFTEITARSVRDGEWAPVWAGGHARAVAYLEALETAGRYHHRIWPVHCEIGTWGHAVHPELNAALQAWSMRELRNLHWVCKGGHPWTEHFSAVRAEVPDPGDPATQTHVALLRALGEADRVLIAGEAGSHCVRASTEHLLEGLPATRRGRLELLVDCMSPVAGFEAEQDAFLAAMRGQGVRLLTAAEALQTLV